MHTCSLRGLICVVGICWLSRFSIHIEKPAKMIARIIVMMMTSFFCLLFLLIVASLISIGLLVSYWQTTLARFVCNLSSWICCSVISDVIVVSSRSSIA